MQKSPKPLSTAEKKILIETRYDDLSKVFRGGGRTRRWLHEQQKKLRKTREQIVVEPIDRRVEIDAKERRIERELKDLRSKYAQAISDRQDALQNLDILTQLESSRPTPIEVKPRSEKKSEAAVICMLSDLHVDEFVLPEAVNGLNRYSKDIAANSLADWARNLDNLTRMLRTIRKVRTLVLPILGDLITGNIHAENSENTWCAPIDGAIYAQSLIAGAIEYIRDNIDFERIIIPCHVGNHARITKKAHHQQEAGNSLETFVYAMLSQHFAKDKHIEFALPRAYLSHVGVLGLTVAMHHGHRVNGGYGIGGIAMPLLRYAHKQDSTRRADLYLNGHFHTAMDLGSVVANGSMIGYSAYSIAHGFPYTRPSQSMILVDSHYGRGPVMPIWCRDR